MELSFRAFYENPREVDVPGADNCKNRDCRDQALRRMLLLDGSGDHSCSSFTVEFHVVKAEFGNRTTVDPAVGEPIQRFAPFVPKRGRQFGSKNVY